MSRKLAAVILLTLASLSLASAFSTGLEAIDREARHDDPARFSLQVQNNFSENTSFQVSSVRAPGTSAGWIDYPRYIEVGPGETKTVIINIKPPKNAVQANYRFNMNIRSFEHGESAQVSDYFVVESEKELSMISHDVSKNKVEPGEELKASLTLKNTAPRTLTDFQVRSEFLGSSSTKEGYELPSGAKLTQSFSLKAPENATPGEEEVKTVLNSSGQVEEVSQTVEIAEVRDIDRETGSENFVLYRSQELSATNNGNSEVSTNLNTTLPTYLSGLTEFYPEPSRVEKDGETIYSWDVELEPGETETVRYTVKYWVPLLALVVLLVIFWALKKIQKPVKVSKTALNTEEGVKARLEIENRSSHEIEGLTVKDYVPDIASIGKDFEMAKPVLRRTKDYTELEWDIDTMKPGEQRVLEYLIRPAVIVEGDLSLPSAEVFRNDEKLVETGEVEAEFSSED